MTEPIDEIIGLLDRKDKHKSGVTELANILAVFKEVKLKLKPEITSLILFVLKDFPKDYDGPTFNAFNYKVAL